MSPVEMRLPRMLSNSVDRRRASAAGLSRCVLVLQLNPGAAAARRSSCVVAGTRRYRRGATASHLRRRAVLRASSSFARCSPTESLSPGWFSVRLLASFCAGASAAAAALMWLNLRGFRAALDDQAAHAMAIGRAGDDNLRGRLRRAGDRALLGRPPRRAGRRAVPSVVLMLALASPLPLLRARPRRRQQARRATARDRRSIRGGGYAAAWSCSRSTAPRSTSSRRPRPTAGCRTSAACSTAARRCTWRPAADAARRPCGRPWRPESCPGDNGVRSAATYHGAAAGRRDRSICCRTSASRTRSCRSGLFDRIDADVGGAARRCRSGSSSGRRACRRRSCAGR